MFKPNECKVSELPISNMQCNDELIDSFQVTLEQELQIRNTVRVLEQGNIPRELLETIFYLYVDNQRKASAIKYLMNRI